jgi:hypothetical protein
MTSNTSQPSAKGDPGSPLGRNGVEIGESTVEAAATSPCPRNAGVIIRASVEHVGLVGDTELTVNVKWPASTFCVQPAKPVVVAGQAQHPQQVPGNGPQAGNFETLYGEADANLAPEIKHTVSGTEKDAYSETKTE